MTTTADLLLAWDQTRPRTQQREFGMSDLGECRRRAGYRLAGTEPTNPSGNVQAVMGTAVHDAIQRILREVAEPDDLVEHEVRFAGILGHLDRYEAATGTVRDVKTTSSRWLGKLRVNGPTRPNLWQVSGYAAGLIAQGHKVRRVGIDYLARDTGAEWRWEEDFDPQHVRDALAWVKQVRETPLEMLNRDHDPDGPFCEGCPFFAVCWEGHIPGRDARSVLFIENPDAAGWAAKLDKARADKADAEAREKEAKGALDAIRPNDKGTSDPVDVGYDKGLQWSYSYPQRLDNDQVWADYKSVGAEPPIKYGKTLTLKFVALPAGEVAA